MKRKKMNRHVAKTPSRGDPACGRGHSPSWRLGVLAVAGFLISGCSALLPPREEVIEPKAAPAPLAANPPAARAAPAANLAEYQVQRGDTLYSLARRHQVKPGQLAAMNGVPADTSLKIGQTLRVPAEARAPAIARDSAPPPIAAPRIAVASSELAPPAPARPDARPDARSAPKAAAAAEPALHVQPVSATPGRLLPAPRRAPLEAPLQSSAAPGPVVDDTVELSSGPALEAEAETPPAARPAAIKSPPPPPAPPAAKQTLRVPDPPARAGAGFLRPVEGRVLVGFGKQRGGLNNDGINIAAARGAPVRAADHGVVVYAGNELRGFGNLLLVSHAGGWMTAYAHLDSMHAARGDKVVRGQRIGAVGMTGNVTSPQLHFEIRKGKQPVDPEDQLTAGAPQAALRPPPVGAAR